MSNAQINQPENIILRPPSEVMRLARMGSFHQTRLSFMRSLTRNLKKENWRFEKAVWQVDDKGVGVAVYTAYGPERPYSLICYANDLDPSKRSDRVIAEEWDATFVLYDGIPKTSDIERLGNNVPKQEAGHCLQSELVMSRANRSVRLFEYVTECLASGAQPDPEKLEQTGYLMRTTAVYGNGKFGLSDRQRIADRPEFAAAFRAELLSVWLIRQFTIDIVEHLAQIRSPDTAVRMDAQIRRRLGVGNSTGLGMAPFLITHPALIHSWINAREQALFRVRQLPNCSDETWGCFLDVLKRSQQTAEEWNTTSEYQVDKTALLRTELKALSKRVLNGEFDGAYPWNTVFEAAKEYSLECQEMIVSLIIEPHGALVDDLAETMAIDERAYFRINASWTVEQLTRFIEEQYAWAIKTDFQKEDAIARFWYVSEEKLEPRMGERFDEDGAEKEQPLAFGRDVANLYQDLIKFNAESLLSEFLFGHPQYRHVVRRVQLVKQLPYAEVQDNLISSEIVPIDLLRCKLSFFGANKFDPRSDRWVRITMFQDAPYPDEFDSVSCDDWIYPPLETVAT